MLRPITIIGQRIRLHEKSQDFVRNKVVYPASLLKPEDKIKLYHRENKDLFGPLLETNKQKKQRAQKEAKNSDRDPNNAKTSESVKFKQITYSSVRYGVDLIGHNMLQNTRTCVNLLGGLLGDGLVRSFQTHAVCKAAKSSPAHPGYVSEDKILQIKQHQNDFAKQYPSVTLILNKTMTEDSRAALEKWKQEKISEIGPEEFEQFYKAQMAVGAKFHLTLKNYFTQPLTQHHVEKDVQGVWESVSDVLKHISVPKAIESNVVHPGLKYRGIFDAIAEYEDKPTLIEWKKSDKPRKSIALTYDNPVQLAAYFGAVCNDLNYKHLNVRDALLVIAYTDGSKADAYHLSIDKLREHWAQWLIRLEEYTKKYGNDSEKILKGGKRLFEEDIGNLQ